MSSTIEVAVAVIVNHRNEVLLSVRHQNAHQGGKWEFPGGKIEADESIQSALSRELLEELSLTVKVTEPYLEINYDYPDKSVLLHVFKVLEYSGAPKGLEGQHVEWIDIRDCEFLEFPDANRAIIEKLLSELS